MGPTKIRVKQLTEPSARPPVPTPNSALVLSPAAAAAALSFSAAAELSFVAAAETMVSEFVLGPVPPPNVFEI